LYQHVSLDKARRAQASADARTQSLKAFLATLVDESDDPQPPSLQDRERLLDLASEQLSAPGAMAQEDRGRLLQSLSDVYKQRGDYARGESLALQAVGLRRSEAGLSLAESLDAVGDARRSAGRLDDAEAPLLEALSLRQAILGSNHPDVAESLNNLGLLRTDQGRLEEGQDLLRRATAIWQAHSSTEPGDDLVALGMTNQGLNLLKQRRLAEAAHHFKEALRRRRQVLPANSPRIATSLHLLGALRDQEGHKEEAAALMTEAHEIRLSVLGASHPVTWVSGRDLAFFYLFGGRLPEAERMASEVLAGLSSSHAESRASMEINMELILAHVTLETGRTREAKERAARAKTLIEKAGLTPVLKQPNVKALLAKIDQA
jgi:tetratricopeptide (TPR) repeat protein